MLKNQGKRISLLITTSLLISIFSSIQAEAAVKAGDICGKKNSTKIVANMKFTCISKNKKLVWNSGVLLKKADSPVSENKPTDPKPSSAPTASPTPISEPKVAKIYISSAEADVDKDCNEPNKVAFTLTGAVVCQNEIWKLVPKDYSISTLAYSYILERWNQQPKSLAKLDIHKDLNAGNWVNDIEVGVQAGARFWGTSSESSPVLPIFISNDHLYIEKEIAAIGFRQSENSKKRNAEAKGGQAGFNMDGGNSAPYLDFLFKSSENLNNVGFFQVGPHEYSHYAQYILGSSDWNKIGPWFNEGVASYVGSALGPMSNMPHNQMDGWRENLSQVQVPLSAFEKDESSVYQSPRWGDIYPMGAVAAEALIALVGFDSVYNLSFDSGKGLSLEENFKKNIGVSRSSLVLFLTDYVISVKNKNDWSLAELRAKFQSIKS